MDAMVAYLTNRGFEATKKYDPMIKKYKFTISKDDHSLTDTFEYPVDISQAIKDRKQRAFLDGIIERFEREAGIKRVTDVLTIEDMRRFLVNKGIAVLVERISDGQWCFAMRKDRLRLDRIYCERDIPGSTIMDVRKQRRYFLDEVIEAFEIEENREKYRKLEIRDYDFTQMYPTTLHASDIINRIINDKEKKMSNNITWTVENITVDRRDNPYDKGSIKAELTGTPNGYVGADSINDVVENLQKKLNDPGYIDTDRVAMAIVGGRQNGKTFAQFNMYRKLLLGYDRTIPSIQKVIFNKPATIVFWADDTKTVVKAQNNEAYDPEKGLAMAITKKALGDKGSYFNEIKKWTGKYEECEQK
jgi:hypothetical protein